MENTIKNRIAIVTVSDNQFIRGTEVLLFSILKYNPWFTGDFIIIHDKLNSRNIKKLKRKFTFIKTIKVSNELSLIINSAVKKNPELKKRYKRFFSLELFKISQYDRILFLDSDIICKQNFQQLLKIKGEFLCCPDLCYFINTKRNRYTFNHINLNKPNSQKNSISDTFNSGMMLIDKTFLNEDTFNNIIKLIDNSIWKKTDTKLTDQICLNLYFEGKQTLINNIYNFRVNFLTEILKKETIQYQNIVFMHFAGIYKPWKIYRSSLYYIRNKKARKFYRFWYKTFIMYLIK